MAQYSRRFHLNSTENFCVLPIMYWPLMHYYSNCKVAAVLWHCALKIIRMCNVYVCSLCICIMFVFGG